MMKGAYRVTAQRIYSHALLVLRQLLLTCRTQDAPSGPAGIDMTYPSNSTVTYIFQA